MALSLVDYVGDGSTTNFTVTFPYISTDYVKVYLDGVPSVAFTWFNSSVIAMNAAPGAGVSVRLVRETDISSKLVDFQDGSVLDPANLDLSTDHILHAVQERVDQEESYLSLETDGKIDANNKVIKNVATPVDGSDAVNKTYADSVITQAQAAKTGAENAQANAETAQGAAEAAETNAGTSETNASASEAKAQKWAEEVEDTEVETGKYSAKHWAAKAEVFGSDKEPTLGNPTEDGMVLSSTAAGVRSWIEPGSNCLGGFKNKLINGNFRINQREVTGTVVLAVGEYGHDRFKAGASGCTYTFATSDNVTTLTITAGSLQQIVEGVNLQTGTYVLSWAGTCQGKIGAGSYTSTGVTGSITGGVDTTVEFGTGTLSCVQLEEGSVATDFEQRHIAQELALCQRYYLTGQTRLMMGGGTSADYFGGTTWFPVQLRAAPTITYWDDLGAISKYRHHVSGNGQTAIGGSVISTYNTLSFQTDAIDGVVGNWIKFNWSADAEF